MFKSNSDVTSRSLVLIACVVLVNMSSCQHEEHDDDHHLEHIIPDHKPVSYREGIEQLDARWKRLSTEGNSVSEVEFSEFIDIIGWLPEIAADSDLMRADWEQVQQITDELVQLTSTSDFTQDATAQDKIEKLIQQLQAFVEKSAADIY